MLFDAGPAPLGISHNSARLAVDWAAVDAMVLSHGHWDHAGGLCEALGRVRSARPDPAPPIPLYLHPGMFGQRGLTGPGGTVIPLERVPDPFQLAGAGAAPLVTTEPQSLLANAFHLSGEIPRVTKYEALKHQVALVWEYPKYLKMVDWC